MALGATGGCPQAPPNQAVHRPRPTLVPTQVLDCIRLQQLALSPHARWYTLMAVYRPVVRWLGLLLAGTADFSTGCRCAPGPVQLSAAQLVRARCCAEEKQLRSCTPIRLKLERC